MIKKRNILKVISASLVLAMATAPMTPVADFFNVGTSITVNAVAGDVIASGDYWTAYTTDTEGKCEIVLKGTLKSLIDEWDDEPYSDDTVEASVLKWSDIQSAIGQNTIVKISAEEGTAFAGNCEDMFYSYYSYLEYVTEIDLSNVDTSNVTSMQSMFENCNSLTALDLSSFDTSNVEDMSYMFENCNSLTALDLSSFDTSNVEDMNSMFCDCESLTALDLSSFDTSNVEDMNCMFYDCESLTALDLSGFDTSNVENMYCMFDACYSLTTLDLSSFDTSNIEDMSYMFYACESLTALDLSSFDTFNVENMYCMFCYCKSLTALDLSGFDTSNVENMYGMFEYCESLTTLDLSGFDTSNSNTWYMFYDCDSLRKLTIGDNFSIGTNAYLENFGDDWIDDYWYNEDNEVISGENDYAVIATGNAGTIIRHFDSNACSEDYLTLPFLDDVVYAGKPVTLDNLRLTVNGEYPLIEGWDYTVEYSNNDAVGLATITFTFINDFADCETLEDNFVILPKAMQASITNRRKAGSNAKATLSGEWYLPKNAVVIQAGIARLSTDNAVTSKWQVLDEGTKKTSILKTASGKYSFSLTMNSTNAKKNLYAVTYVTYQIGDKMFTSVSDIDSSIINPVIHNDLIVT